VVIKITSVIITSNRSILGALIGSYVVVVFMAVIIRLSMDNVFLKGRQWILSRIGG
jgi:hypothetical protein